MSIRDAERADLPAIVAIYNASIGGDDTPLEAASRQSWFEHHHPDSYPLRVLEIEGAVAGWVGLEPFYGHPQSPNTAEISLYVARAHQSQGLGRRLLDDGLTRARALGFATLLACVFAHNEISVRLLKGAGFQAWGNLPDIAEMDGNRYNLRIFGRPLS